VIFNPVLAQVDADTDRVLGGEIAAGKDRRCGYNGSPNRGGRQDCQFAHDELLFVAAETASKSRPSASRPSA
jgi:hypothetical protein